MSGLRPETILRRKIELQAAVRYQTELLALRRRVADLGRELADERRKAMKRASLCSCSGGTEFCACEWCVLADEAVAECKSRKAALAAIEGPSVPDRTFIHP